MIGYFDAQDSEDHATFKKVAGILRDDCHFHSASGFVGFTIFNLHFLFILSLIDTANLLANALHDSHFLCLCNSKQSFHNGKQSFYLSSFFGIPIWMQFTQRLQIDLMSQVDSTLSF